MHSAGVQLPALPQPVLFSLFCSACSVFRMFSSVFCSVGAAAWSVSVVGVAVWSVPVAGAAVWSVPVAGVAVRPVPVAGAAVWSVPVVGAAVWSVPVAGAAVCSVPVAGAAVWSVPVAGAAVSAAVPVRSAPRGRPLADYSHAGGAPIELEDAGRALVVQRHTANWRPRGARCATQCSISSRGKPVRDVSRHTIPQRSTIRHTYRYFIPQNTYRCIYPGTSHTQRISGYTMPQRSSDIHDAWSTVAQRERHIRIKYINHKTHQTTFR